MTLLTLTVLQWVAVGLLIYVVVALPFALFLGRAVRHGTEVPEREDWLWDDDEMWVWPHNRDAA